MTMQDLLVAIGLPLVAGFLVMALITAWGTARWRRAALGWLLAVGIGYAAAHLLISPLPESGASWGGLDWLVVAVVPAAVIVGLVMLGGRGLRRLAGLVGVIVAIGLAPLLLWEQFSGQVNDWALWQRLVWLAALAIGVGLVWRSLMLLQRRQPGRGLPLGLTVTAAGTVWVFWLAGESPADELGWLALALTAVLVGAVVGSFGLRREVAAAGAGVVSWLVLSSLLLIGWFGGEQPYPVAVGYLLLALAPILGWVGEDPLFRRWQPIPSAVLRLLVTVATVLLAVLLVGAGYSQMEPKIPDQPAAAELEGQAQPEQTGDPASPDQAETDQPATEDQPEQQAEAPQQDASADDQAGDEPETGDGDGGDQAESQTDGGAEGDGGDAADGGGGQSDGGGGSGGTSSENFHSRSPIAV